MASAEGSSFPCLEFPHLRCGGWLLPHSVCHFAAAQHGDNFSTIIFSVPTLAERPEPGNPVRLPGPGSFAHLKFLIMASWVGDCRRLSARLAAHIKRVPGCCDTTAVSPPFGRWPVAYGGSGLTGRSRGARVLGRDCVHIAKGSAPSRTADSSAIVCPPYTTWRLQLNSGVALCIQSSSPTTALHGTDG